MGGRRMRFSGRWDKFIFGIPFLEKLDLHLTQLTLRAVPIESWTRKSQMGANDTAFIISDALPAYRSAARVDAHIVSVFPINIHERSHRGYFPGGQIAHETD